MHKAKGHCLCKSVRFSFDLKEKVFDACHCGMCRRWGGGPALTVKAHDNIVFEGQDNIALYNSSDWAERGFCMTCGTHLFYRFKEGSFCNFNLGTLEGHDSFTFATQIYIDAKPKNYDFANETCNMTEKDVIEAFQ